MISYLRGTIKLKEEVFVVVVVSGVGYKVFLLERDLSKTKVGEAAEFFTYHYVREDDERLYGFSNLEELEMFELLFSITGIGPKSAMGILNIAPINSLKAAIVKKDVSLLTKVSGVGRKTAERVVLELASKIKSSSKTAEETSDLFDAVEALMSLGYSRTQALSALEKIPENISDAAEKVRLALKSLGKK